ncbi:hypothetical protein BKA69DRAFT_1162856 [Paraphysoderma sedebokerense]|nr:hypothetical protein BKA69DRAFT_1162856 [Paraphysoderma sedebokerense]
MSNDISSLRFNNSPEDIEKLASELILNTKTVYDGVAAVKPEECDFDKVIAPIAISENENFSQQTMCSFMKYVSPDKAVRDASTDATKKIQDFQIELSMREDVYKSVHAASAHRDISKLDSESQRLVKKLVLDFERNGLALPVEKREKLKALKKRLSDIYFISGLEKIDGKCKVTMSYPDRFPVMRKAKNEETRKEVDLAANRMCKDNIALLEEAVQIRREASTLLGYGNHAAYRLEINMAKSPEAVSNFLQDLKTKLLPVGHRDLERLKELKRKDDEAAGRAYDGSFHSWDFQYYHTLLLSTEYSVDQEIIKPYFPLQSVTQRMLDIYCTLFNIEVSEIKNAAVWHPDVQLFKVTDSENNETLGYFYLDLFPREGKYKHAACFLLRPGFVSQTGERMIPISAMVANFSKPTQDAPSLLKHDEVVTYFHELGHVFHQLLSQTKYSRFHGTNVERDFVECPSQLLENWCWTNEGLSKLSSHYQTSKPIPTELVEKIVKAKNVNSGLLNLRQLTFGLFDLTIHTVKAGEEKVDTTHLFNKCREEVGLIKAPEGTFGQATFDHLMGGYDAGYYGYMWSLVYSADIFYSRFLPEGVLNKKVGLDYRSKVLTPGGSRDGMDMLVDFLGREPRNENFLKSIGVEAESHL